MSGSGGSDRDTGSPVKFEDTLSDFQLPKRYTKPDGKAADYSNKAPAVYITGGSQSQDDAPPSGEQDDSQSFGTLLHTWESDRPAGAGGANDCTACGKRVYEMEKMLADKAIYHKTCFKCNHCKRVLSLGNFASLEGYLYCKPHFLELFRKKGNYEEGFGIERHSKQWQVDQPELDSEGAVARYEPTDIDQNNTDYTGEDGGHDEYDSRQNIGSIKSRYEGYENRSPSPTDQDRSNVKAVRDWDQSASPTENGMDWTGSDDLVKTTNEREEIPYTEIKSVRNIFEKNTPSSEARYTPASKKSSKWDKPKQDVPVDVVNASREEEAEEQVATPDTRNLVAKFRDLEQSSRGIPSPERTPSRPVYRQAYDTTDSTPRMTVNETSNEQQAEDGGVFENKPAVNPDLVRETDRADTEELPERGFTKSLLEQWRAKEKDHTPGSERKARGSRSSSAPPHRPRVPYSGQPGDDQDTTDGDRYQAKHTSYTRTMLSKFQTVDTESTPPRSPAKRQFKWQVKEVRPMIRGARTPDTTDHGDREHMDYEQHGVQEYQSEQRAGGDQYSDEQRDDDGMPPPSFTRTMLAKFKSLEDLTKPPPSPVRSQQLLKDSPHGTVVSVRKICAYDEDGLHHPQREQPDGGEYEHDHIANEMLQYDDEEEEEDDTDLRHSPRRRDSQEQELPEHGTTRSLLAKFQALQTAH